MKQPYDCTEDVNSHIGRVQILLSLVNGLLVVRSLNHDKSKLEPPEKECFDKWTPVLKQTMFGTPEYKEALSQMGVGLQHHHANNCHHPEYFSDGIAGMTLIDVIEMVCDWIAAAEKRGVPVGLDHAVERFGIEPQLASVIKNTISTLGARSV